MLVANTEHLNTPSGNTDANPLTMLTERGRYRVSIRLHITPGASQKGVAPSKRSSICRLIGKRVYISRDIRERGEKRVTIF